MSKSLTFRNEQLIVFICSKMVCITMWWNKRKTYHIWPLGACRDTWLLYWKAGCSLDNTGSYKDSLHGFRAWKTTFQTEYVSPISGYITYISFRTYLHLLCTNPAYDASSSDRLQGSWQAEDPPVSLSQLNNLVAHVLQADTVPPLQENSTNMLLNQVCRQRQGTMENIY